MTDDKPTPLRAVKSAPEMPEFVKAGPLTYTIEMVDDMDEAHDAETHHDTMEMKISDRTTNPVGLRIVMVHELLHIALALKPNTIDWRDVIGRDGDPEELMVELMDDRLFSILKDNPALVKWITS